MNTFFPGTAKPVLVQCADDLEILKVEYPLSYMLLVRKREGSSTSSFYAGCLAVTVRLRRWCNAFEAWTPSDRLVGISDLLTKVALIAIASYFLFKVGWAFLPGGAVERVMGGVR
jgi:hypothetical protein